MKYYVPCPTPLSITITLDGRGEFALHPLDLTAEPPDNPNAATCIQAADSTFNNPSFDIGDLIFGV